MLRRELDNAVWRVANDQGNHFGKWHVTTDGDVVNQATHHDVIRLASFD